MINIPLGSVVNWLCIYSSSSTAAEATPIWQQQQPPQQAQPQALRNGVQPSSTQYQGKEYSRLEAPLTQPDTLFSSEGSSSSSEEGPAGPEWGPDPQKSPETPGSTTDKPSFRWDGTPLVDKTKESKLVKKVKSLDQQERNEQENRFRRERSLEDEIPPIPPIRESSVKREEIKWKLIGGRGPVG